MVGLPAIAALAICHLGLVAAGTGRFDFRRVPLVGEALEYYGSLSGAKASYGFFAPEITGQGGVEFEVFDAAGKSKTVPLEVSANHELEVRVADIVERFAGIYLSSANDPDAGKNPATRELWQALAASLCGTVMGRHPDAREVVFRLKNYALVTMEEYQRGLRPHWDVIYEARFRRAK